MQPPENARRMQYQSAQSLRIEMRFGEQVLSVGTAFVVQSALGALVLTNRHNVTGRHQDTGEPLSRTGGLPDNIIVWYHRKGKPGEWVGISHKLFSLIGTPQWIEHPTLKERADFVALRVPSTVEPIELHPYDPSNPGPDIFIGPAEPVSVVGFPLDIRVNGFVPVWATGFIASEPELDVDDLPIFLIDCRTRQGQSGSPVIAYRTGATAHANGAFAVHNGPVARFLGIYSGRVHKDSDLGKVWKASAVADLVTSVQPTFSMQPSSYGMASYTYGPAIVGKK